MNGSEMIAQLELPTGETAIVSGNAELVRRVAGLFTAAWDGKVTTIDSQSNENTPMFLTNMSVSQPTNGSVQTPNDLLQLYQKVQPVGQYEQVVLIGFHLKYNKDMEDWGLDDVEACYRELIRIPVKPPKNIKGAVRNTVDRSNFIRNSDVGRYSITLAGEAYITQRLK
jgi:hypothetical protein